MPPTKTPDIRKISAAISIVSEPIDKIKIYVYDRDSQIDFVELTLTNDQFIAAMVGQVERVQIERAIINHFDLVGKKMEVREITVELSVAENEGEAKEKVIRECPFGWTPDTIYEYWSKEGINYAKTSIRRWIA